MSNQYGPRIVTDGLVLCLDAGNSKSYPGSGNTWYDLSGNNNHCTLYNGVGYSSNNGGILTFDGIDDYGSLNLDLRTTNHTIIATARYTGSKNKRVISSNSNNWLMGWWEGQVNKYYAEGWVSNSGGDSAETSWINFTAVGNYVADIWALYRNGVLRVSNNAGIQGPHGLRFGNSGIYAGEISACEIKSVLAYNRALTVSEITQNHNATKGRFGL